MPKKIHMQDQVVNKVESIMSCPSRILRLFNGEETNTTFKSLIDAKDNDKKLTEEKAAQGIHH